MANSVRFYQADLVGLDLLDTFWKPIGQQFIGTLISHLKKQKITTEGAKILAKDIDEYYNVSFFLKFFLFSFYSTLSNSFYNYYYSSISLWLSWRLLRLLI